VSTILETWPPRNWGEGGGGDSLFLEELLTSEGGLSCIELIVWLVLSVIHWVGNLLVFFGW
jgi:hypothetical protein